MRPLLLQITVWEDRARLGGLETNWNSVFYGKLTRTAVTKILSVSKLWPDHYREKKKEINFAITVTTGKRYFHVNTFAAFFFFCL